MPASRCHLSAATIVTFFAAACSLAAPPTAKPLADEVARLRQQGFPMIDFHVHLKGGLTLEEALAESRRTGIRYGIAANCGQGFPITDDRGIGEFLRQMAGRPAFVGMQAEGREWPKLFSKQAVARFDYVFTDAMTITDHRGRRARLWINEEVDIPDAEAFMERLVRTTVEILDREPIDIYVNPTFLPEVIAKDYDKFWTPQRQRKVIEAAARNGVAIEISNRYRLPKPAFILAAKRAGVKFTLGTNNADRKLGRCEYGIEIIHQCGLTPQDFWMPKPKGKKPIEVRGLLVEIMGRSHDVLRSPSGAACHGETMRSTMRSRQQTIPAGRQPARNARTAAVAGSIAPGASDPRAVAAARPRTAT